MRQVVCFFIVLVVFLGCQKNNFEIKNLNGNEISFLGHGGMGIGHVYPLNSFESILNCLSIGADGTEIDIQMTKDGVLVAFHDKYLEQSTDATGKVHEKTWCELENVAFNLIPYTSYRIVKLEQLFENIPNLNSYSFFLDCKDFNSDGSEEYIESFNNALVNLIERFYLQENIYVELKREDLIKDLKNRYPWIKIFVFKEFDSALNVVNTYDLEGVTCSIDEISAEDVLEAHENGAMVAVYNAHSKARNVDAINRNVDFIQTDKLKHLLRVLK